MSHTMGRTVHLPTNLPQKSTIHVGKYTNFPWICHGYLVMIQKSGSKFASGKNNFWQGGECVYNS